MTELDVQVKSSITDYRKDFWNRVLKDGETGTVFQRYEWLRAYEESHDATPRHIAVEANGQLYGSFPVFLHRIGQTPLFRTGGAPPGTNSPLVLTREQDVLDALLDEFESVVSDESVVLGNVSSRLAYELRYGRQLQARGYQPNLRTTEFRIDATKSIDELESEMRSGTRRQFRKARDGDWDVEVLTPDDQNLIAFYSAYSRHMDRVDGERIPFGFLYRISRYLDEVKLFRVFVDGRRVGERLCVIDDHQSMIHAPYPAVDEEDFEYYPTHLLYYYLVTWGKQNGYETINLGSAPADFQDGTYNFKSGFGTDVYPRIKWQKTFSTVARLLYPAWKRLYDPATVVYS